MPHHFEPTQLPGVVIVTAKRFGDTRGWFSETYNATSFAEAGIGPDFHQDNEAWSQKAFTLRGLHYQLDPGAQGKLVRCVKGAILDVAVDIRPGSPRCGQHVAIRLDADHPQMLWVPPGFAHGYCTLIDDCRVVYKATTPYRPELERAIAADDPELAIDWPASPGTAERSPRDVAAPRYRDAMAEIERISTDAQ